MKNIKSFSDLATVKAGDSFVYRGREHRAYEDAETGENRFTGEEYVFVQAGLKNPAMPSGFELCDIIAHASRF